SAHLPGRYLLNGLKTPTSLAPKSKDLVYAYSVLTHLREKAVRAWLEEVHRVLRPGGLALLTFHDEGYARAWGPPGVAERLEGEPFIVLNDAMEGSNYLSSWTTSAQFTAMAAPLVEVLEIVPGRRDNPTQAIAVLRARAE
ncbi:MAG: class I SAM-dependent methyltransferase, partial [Proteobacteria bacterium]|nr:class I SAM-dependent methyltransferase [Pseudomonadota bacterium]